MCGRYAIDDDALPKGWLDSIGALNRTAPALKTRGEIFPGDVVPVIANSRRLMPRLFAMKWGYTLPDGRILINARSETACDKLLFADGMKHRRCLIPASRYFEWDRHSPERDKYAIGSAQTETLCLAGIYRFEQGRPVFTILTRTPADSIAFLHDRMPVMFSSAKARSWLDPAHSAQQLLQEAVTEVVYRACSPVTPSFLGAFSS